VTTKHLFNEEALLAEIIQQWGEYGAHAEVCTFMINEIKNLRTIIQNLVNAERAYADISSQYDEETSALDKLNQLWDQIMALPWIE